MLDAHTAEKAHVVLLRDSVGTAIGAVIREQGTWVFHTLVEMDEDAILALFAKFGELQGKKQAV